MFDINVTWTHFTNYRPSLISPISEDVKYVDMDVRVVPDWNVSVYLEWAPIVPPESGTGDVSYTVYYSESELGPFLPLTAQPLTDSSFFTTWQRQDSKVFEQYFTIESYFSDGRRYRSYPMTPNLMLSKWHRLRHRDIIRRESILLDKFVGVETIVFNPKYHGKRCTNCWDPVHLKIMKDHCEECYGQGYDGGYDTGMKTLFQYSSIDAQSGIGYQGRVEPITLSAWTISFPVIHPDAILLRLSDRKVFVVEGHQGSTEMHTTVQRQNVVIKELSRDSIENKLFNNTNVLDVMPRRPHLHN